MLVAAHGLELPLVAAVTGHAIGGGMLLTLCADYRVALHRRALRHPRYEGRRLLPAGRDRRGASGACTPRR